MKPLPPLHETRFSRSDMVASTNIPEHNLANWGARKCFPLYAHASPGRGKARQFTRGEVISVAIVVALDRLAVSRDFSTTFAHFALRIVEDIERSIEFYEVPGVDTTLTLVLKDLWELAGKVTNEQDFQKWEPCAKLIAGKEAENSTPGVAELRLPIGEIIRDVNNRLSGIA